jgi:hypothetical protein
VSVTSNFTVVLNDDTINNKHVSVFSYCNIYSMLTNLILNSLESKYLP